MHCVSCHHETVQPTYAGMKLNAARQGVPAFVAVEIFTIPMDRFVPNGDTERSLSIDLRRT